MANAQTRHPPKAPAVGRSRSGLAQTQLLILGAVIAALIILGGAGFVIYRNVTSGAESNALKANLDRVAVQMENYWQQYALNSDGTRDIDLSEICPFLNSTLTSGNDLTLRTMHWKSLSGSAFEPEAAGGGVTAPVASCPSTAVHAAETGAGATKANSNIKHKAATGGTISAWQNVGLGSTSGVWISQPYGLSGGTNIPAGTANPTGGATGTAASKNEVLVVGGVTPGGKALCLVKVFDADDRALLGEYRYERDIVATAVTWSKRCFNLGTGTNQEKPANRQIVID